MRPQGIFLFTFLAALPLSGQGDPLRVVAMPKDEGDVFDRSRSVVRALDESFLREWRVQRDRALAEGVKTLVLDLTAASGDWATTRQLLDDVADLRANGVRVAAFVPEFAEGPAALVALEADRIILGAGARVGPADPAAISGALEGGRSIETARKESLARAATSARRNGYPELVVEAMIDPEIEILAVRRRGAPIAYVRGDRLTELPADTERDVVERKGELLRLDRMTAERLGFPVGGAESHDDLRRALGLSDRPLDDMELLTIAARDLGPTEWQGFDWSLILLAAGMLFLVLELKTPGLGIMGVLGIVSLSAYFLVNAGGGPGSLFSIGFLLVGFLLLLVEILVLPGFGVAGILGIVLIVFSVYSATIGLGGDTLREQLIPDSPADYQRVKMWLVRFLATLIAGAGGALALAPRLHHFPFMNRVYLKPPTLEAPEGHRQSGEVPTTEGAFRIDVGARGVAETDLRPSGTARIRERRVDVVADGEFVSRGSRVIVVAVEGARVVVRREDDAS